MKYSMFIGRWQPWHDGHRWLINQRLNEGKNVLICIREVSQDDKNPYNPEEVKKNIENELYDLIYENKVKVIIIPDIESVNYGRGVGYDIIEHIPPKDIGKISNINLLLNFWFTDLVATTVRMAEVTGTVFTEIPSYPFRHSSDITFPYREYN